MPTYGIAVPGTVVPSGSQASPAGAQGIQGSAGGAGSAGPAGANSWTLTTASFNVPAAGASVTVNVADTSWTVVGEWVWVDQAGGGVGQGAALQVTAKTPTSLTLLNSGGATLPSVPPTRLINTTSPLAGGGDLSADRTLSIPTASAATAGILNQLSGNQTDYVAGDNSCQPLQPVIWSARLRSFSSIGNPTFEVDQRNVGATVNNIAGGAFICDRWAANQSGLSVNTTRQINNNRILIPGTNFAISNYQLQAAIATQKTSLAATDFWYAQNVVEGPAWRELSSDVHSLSFLAYSTVVTSFSVAIRDTPVTKSLVKLCSINANTWTLFTLPNLPVFPSGNFSSAPGAAGYVIAFVLSCGSNLISPAADVWQTGNYLGAPGMSNWHANASGSFFLGFVQHEPGPLCTTLQDKPFTQNLDECLRYYQKSYEYEVAVGAVNTAGIVSLWQQSTTTLSTAVRFHKPMAKLPTVTAYNHATGAVNSVRMAGTDYTVSAVGNPGKTGFQGLTTSTMPAVAAGNTGFMHFTADTGW